LSIAYGPKKLFKSQTSAFYYLGSQTAPIRAISPEVGKEITEPAAQVSGDPNFSLDKV